jgi:hypothetical protein
LSILSINFQLLKFMLQNKTWLTNLANKVN